MRDDFESIRAERDAPLQRPNSSSHHYSGLWKQIALGIVIGYLALGLLAAVGWWAFAKLALSGLQITTP
ncbi:hypothetical protein [Aquipseudomonas alcaligenes]|uniref:hypothetical protein n=1 Tax=Aquipseudomonas alcaligenes TaxID=43263 RepID=UPI00374A5DEA